MPSRVPATPARVRSSFRQKCRDSALAGLYRTGLLNIARHMEGTHELYSIPGSRFPRLRQFAGSKFGILCYHRVGTEGIPLFSRLAPDLFEKQMRYVRKNYRVVSLGQLCQELQEHRSAQPPTLAVTFDDGYRDLYDHAFSVLQKYRIPATIYLIGRCMKTGEAPWYDRIFAAMDAAPVDRLVLELESSRAFDLSYPGARSQAAWEIVCYLRVLSDKQRREWCTGFEERMKPPEKPLEACMLNWEQVRAMRCGGISFGAHTMTHPVVSRLEPQGLQEELLESKQFLEAGLDCAVEDFAYPFGKPEDAGGFAEDFLENCGYRSAVTTTYGFNTTSTNRFRLNRLQVGESWSTMDFAFNVSRLFFQGRTER